MKKTVSQICAAGFAGMVLFGLFLIAPQWVQAHARIMKSIPQDKAELEQPPAQVELWFDELLDRQFNNVEVFRASEIKAPKRKNLAKSEVLADPRDRTHLILPLPPLPPGDYAVEWRVLSRDGHSARGRFTFRVKTK